MSKRSSHSSEVGVQSSSDFLFVQKTCIGTHGVIQGRERQLRCRAKGADYLRTQLIDLGE